MQTFNRTQIINSINSLIKSEKNAKVEFIHKDTGNVFIIDLKVEKSEYFIDKEGTKWKKVRE